MIRQDRHRSALLLSFPEYEESARSIADAAALDYSNIETHRFPDGECRIRIPVTLPAQVVFCCSLYQPNRKLVELLLAATTARRLGAKHICLVAPYLCYMRQDKAFRPGEAISQTIVGEWLATMFDALLTVDPHLHRIHDLRDAVPMESAIALSAAQPMAKFLQGRFDNPLLLGPDIESEQWVAAISRFGSSSYQVARKKRVGDRDVVIELPDGEYQGCHVVLVDDIASTGCTLENVARTLKSRTPASISVLVTHALFEGGAEERLRRAGVDQIWSCDSVPHPTNRIGLAKTLASPLKTILAGSHSS